MPTYADNPHRSQTIPTTERAPLGGEHVLPAWLPGGAGVLPRQSLGQMHGAETFGHVLPMQKQCCFDLRAQLRRQTQRQCGYAVLVPLALADHDFAARELDILHAQPQSLEQAHACAVKQSQDEPLRSGQAPEHCTNLVACQDHRQSRGALCSRDPVEPGQFDVQYLTIHKHYGRKRLILGGRGQVPLDRERSQECLDFGAAELPRAALAMKKYVASNPEYIGVFGAHRILQSAQPVTNLVQQLARRRRGLMRLHMDNILVEKKGERIQRLPALRDPIDTSGAPRYPATSRSNSS
jgi:hypothetical protein